MSPTAKRTQRSPRKLDRTKTAELAEQGMSTADIAQHQGVAPSTVFRFLQQTTPERQALERFKKERGDVFARLAGKALNLQERIVDTFDEAVISALKPSEKGNLIHQLGIAAAVHYDKERLERNLTTANVGLLGRLVVAAEASIGVPAKAANKTDPT
jgi:predicted transcriptional regulator